jgi:hypothetical protein
MIYDYVIMYVTSFPQLSVGIINELDPLVFQDRLTEVFKILNIWFNANLLSLNVSKTDYIKFTTKNFYEQDNYINIACVSKNISD